MTRYMRSLALCLILESREDGAGGVAVRGLCVWRHEGEETVTVRREMRRRRIRERVRDA
ncbi:hypothetical protein E2C01_092531 [Portunus trituberculatus]|uniref:Uncharacterized protein n=1 Tax=Portunus trituberculatus TaxID=210409 RepID=A0A5B7JVP2_PORTR|nr:hypothetical protein [Portunus trituberculatus]